MSLVTDESNAAARNVTEQRNAPLSNAERQRLYRERQQLKRAQAQGTPLQPAQEAPESPNAAEVAEPSAETSARPGTSPGKPKRPVTPTPVAEKPIIDPSRPSLYTEEIAAEVCERLSNGETLNRICTDAHMPSKPTVIRWANEMPDFADRYARARDRQIEAWAEEVLDKADATSIDNGAVQRDRLAVDARKWLLSKLKPEKYGDRLDARLANPDGTPIQAVDAAAAIAALLAALPSLAPPALPAPTVLDAEAVPVEREGEQ